MASIHFSQQKEPKTETGKMMKIFVILSALVAIALAKASVPVVAAAPLVAAPAPIVTATSSQYYHRINNGLAAYVAPAYAPYAAASYVAAPAPYVASPYVAAPGPYVAAAASPIIAV